MKRKPGSSTKPVAKKKAASKPRGEATSTRGPAKAKVAAGAKSKPPASAKPTTKSNATPKPKRGRRGTAGSEAGEPLPSILLESETASLPSISGPGQRYALGPGSVDPQRELMDDLGELPEAYGSKRLFLAARDPHWLYAHWDYTADQLRECNEVSADRQLLLRVYAESFSSPPCNEVRVHPQSRNWFVHVGRGGAKYVAELGCYRKGDREWVSFSRSAATLTPPDVLAGASEVEFATIPPEVPFPTLVAMVQAAAKDTLPLAEAIQQLRAAGYPGLPEPIEWPKTDWTPAQEQALAAAIAESVSMDGVRRVWVGSLEITEMLRRRMAEQRGSAELLSSAGLPVQGQPVFPLPSSISSPYGGGERAKGFWFNVNAELIIYGATEPDAHVTLAGLPIRLRPDGTFSFRFALPDGRYELPAVALSADRSDQRQAALVFSRSTTTMGEVGVHPQDPNLKPPDASGLE